MYGETKTERSRRTFGLPAAAARALRAWSGSQAGERLAAGDGWQDTGHASTRTTAIVYRRELRPVITTGAGIMNELFTGI